ncbi:PH domain-containing protein [Agrococcus jejuensis]|uniref:Putative membrane protein n=1 Tax=Agrococcus jejuensis TaxID=399736 RepID=A0A1G8C1D5_9MICO|nr:PH domain-containing protein [Agrococcus jejuensis]SDH39143.1 putative membrane protein [Agrococcus jejuensis]
MTDPLAPPPPGDGQRERILPPPPGDGQRERILPPPAAATMVPPAEQPPVEAQERARSLVDGEWHRLHPATPLLRGGLAVIVAAFFLLNTLRDRVVALFLPEDFDYDGDAPDAIEAAEQLARSGTLIWVLLGLVAVLALCVLGFWLAWRVHTFRVTGDVVEVRQGILFRSHRRAPLARIQGVNLEKPWFARIFGACKLEIQSAGADANVDLAYLSNGLADALRYEILARAAGRTSSQQHQQQTGSRTQRVVDDFLRPDAELAGIAPTSLVRLKPGTVIVSSLLDLGLVIGVLVSVAAVVVMVVLDIPWLLFTLIPTVISVVSITVRTLSQKLRYSIAQTPDGIRLAYGLLSTTTEVLPPGRVFSITVSQPLLWRPMGWWKIAFTRATKTTDASSGQQRQYANMLLPVGSLADVDTVIGLVLPELRGTRLLRDGLVGRGVVEADADAVAEDGDAPAPAHDGFVTTPRSARILRPLSWRRNGVAIADDAVLLRKGRIWRSLGIVPLARTQSFAMHQGPLEGALGVAHLAVHVVGNAFSPTIGALAVDDAQRTFAHAREVVPAAIGADTTETWHVREPEPAMPGEPVRPGTVDGFAGPIDVEQQHVTNRTDAAAPTAPAPQQHPGAEARGDEHQR